MLLHMLMNQLLEKPTKKSLVPHSRMGLQFCFLQQRNSDIGLISKMSAVTEHSTKTVTSSQFSSELILIRTVNTQYL